MQVTYIYIYKHNFLFNIMVIVGLGINTKVKPQAVCRKNTKEKWLILISGIKGRLPGRVDI